jgi:hemerythrin-like domain-containing protein
MSPTDTLRHEHQIILLVIAGAEREAQRLRTGSPMAREAVEQMVDFFKNFVDRCHHAKEEQHLFPALEARGLPSQFGPVGVMLHEHEQGRALVHAIADALPPAAEGDAAAREGLAGALESYAELLRSHIQKEDTILFVMAEQALSADEQERLAGVFERVEAEEIGPGVHERYHQLAHRLAAV